MTTDSRNAAKTEAVANADAHLGNAGLPSYSELLHHLTRLIRAIDRMPANAADGLADEAREFVAQVQA